MAEYGLRPFQIGNWRVALAKRWGSKELNPLSNTGFEKVKSIATGTLRETSHCWGCISTGEGEENEGQHTGSKKKETHGIENPFQAQSIRSIS